MQTTRYFYRMTYSPSDWVLFREFVLELELRMMVSVFQGHVAVAPEDIIALAVKSLDLSIYFPRLLPFLLCLLHLSIHNLGRRLR